MKLLISYVVAACLFGVAPIFLSYFGIAGLPLSLSFIGFVGSCILFYLRLDRL